MLFLVLWLPGLKAGEEPQGDAGATALLPYHVEHEDFRRARLLEAAGKYAQAAELLEKGEDLPGQRHLLAGVLFEKAGRPDAAAARYRAAWEKGGPLALTALWRSYRLKGGDVPPELWRADQAFTRDLLYRQALARYEEGHMRAAVSLLMRVLSRPAVEKQRARAQLLLARSWLAASDPGRGRELASVLYWNGNADAGLLLGQSAPDELQFLSRLHSLMNTGAGGEVRAEDRELRQRLARVKALRTRKETREQALSAVQLLVAEFEAEDPAGIAARYQQARLLENMDRDMEALDLFNALVQAPARFLPFRTAVLCRMGRIALREGFPSEADRFFSLALRGGMPGENLAEALWGLAWARRLEGRTDAALELLRFLVSRWFWEPTGGVGFWGPKALYWQARILEETGDGQSAGVLYSFLARAFPMDYHGLLSRTLLGTVLPSSQADFDRSPLSLSCGEDEAGRLGPELELWRLGLYAEALEELRYGGQAPAINSCAASLNASLSLRAASSPREVFRSYASLMPPPWECGALLWLSILPLRFTDLLEANGRLDRALLGALIRYESGFNPSAVSVAGAGGLMQLKRGVAQHVARVCLNRSLKKRELFQEKVNLDVGSLFLRELQKRHHENWLLSLASYNAGPGACLGWLRRFSGLDAEELVEQFPFPGTSNYVKRIVTARDAYFSLYWPVLGRDWSPASIARALPDGLQPYLDEEGSTCR